MSSSEENDEFPYNFPNKHVSANGQNFSKFGNNNMMGTNQTNRGFVQPEDIRMQRNINSRRESSTRSICFECNLHSRIFQFPNYPVLNPIASTNLVSATDIALSLQNKKFNILDVEIIKKAYNAFIRRFQEIDSGEQGVSYLRNYDNDDDNTRRNSIFRENIPTGTCSINSRASRRRQTIASFRRGRSSNFSQNSCRNISPQNIGNLSNNSQVRQFGFEPLQKDRFKNIYTFPSQRFNRLVTDRTIEENVSQVQPTCDENNTEANVTNESNCEGAVSEVPAEINSYRNTSSGKRNPEEDQNIATTSTKRQEVPAVKNIPNQTSIQNTTLIDKESQLGVLRTTFKTNDLELPKSLNKDNPRISPHKKTQTNVRTNRFWETDLESDDEVLVNLDVNLPQSQINDKTSANVESLVEPRADQITKCQDNNEKSNNSEQAFYNDSNRTRSRRGPKKVKCVAEPELSIINVPGKSVTCNSKDNNLVKDIENNKNKSVTIKKDSATGKAVKFDKNKQSDVEAGKSGNKIPPTKATLKSNTKGQAKPAVLKKHVTLCESVSGTSTSRTGRTRNRTRTQVKKSTCNK